MREKGRRKSNGGKRKREGDEFSGG